MKKSIKQSLDNLLGIEQALWVIAFAIIWKPLGLIVFVLLFWIEDINAKKEKK